MSLLSPWISKSSLGKDRVERGKSFSSQSPLQLRSKHGVSLLKGTYNTSCSGLSGKIYMLHHSQHSWEKPRGRHTSHPDTERQAHVPPPTLIIFLIPFGPTAQETNGLEWPLVRGHLHNRVRVMLLTAAKILTDGFNSAK